MFNVGDIITYDVGDGRHILAHVDSVFPTYFGTEAKLTVTFLDPNVHPSTMQIPESRCKLFSKPSEKSACECGAEKTHGKKVNEIYHATWCPMVPKGSYGKHN